ncbi:MAG: glycosyltransferase family 61 protein, partial [Prolixibacteraceae bacterium]|nr:glycosyltransferase family 61 protein [Prolixibacteraceae bacterium]
MNSFKIAIIGIIKWSLNLVNSFIIPYQSEKYEKRNYIYSSDRSKNRFDYRDIEDKRVKDSFRRTESRLMFEYVYFQQEECIIEPRFGWGITPKRKIIRASLPFKFYSFRPGLKVFFLILLKKYEFLNEKYVISLRDVGEGNYYHLYSEILAKLFLLKKYGVDIDVPVIVSENLFKMYIFQEVSRLAGLNNLNWILQKDNLIGCRSVYFCRALPANPEYLLNFKKNRLFSVPVKNPQKIFLNRGKNSGRTIINFSLIKKVLINNGFEIVESEKMDLQDQINMFSSATYIIGIHGAGLTNLIFAGKNLNGVIEIFPPYNIPPHYYWICTALSLTYKCLVGESKSNKTNMYSKADFGINPNKLEIKIKE